MSGPDDDNDDKQFEPTQKKLDDARKKGEIPRSTDLNVAASYGGFVLVALIAGPATLSRLGEVMAGLLSNSDRYSKTVFSDSAQPFSGGLMLALSWPLAPWFLLPPALVILVVIAQRGLVFAPEKLRPKLSRISLLSNAKNKFGRSGLFEFGKSFFKLVIYSTILAYFLSNKTPEILGTLYATPAMAVAMLLRLAVQFMLIVLLIAMTMGAVDYLWQYQEHMRRNRMSRKDMTDESKESEGDPHMKQQRRQKGYTIAMNQMLAEVPNADVIIVNPQHYAIALQWSRMPGEAPVCVAKGVDEIAARIREIAAESAIPIHRDPPTARAIYASVEIGQEIWAEHYAAVAAAIRFAETMRKKARGLHRALDTKAKDKGRDE